MGSRVLFTRNEMIITICEGDWGSQLEDLEGILSSDRALRGELAKYLPEDLKETTEKSKVPTEDKNHFVRKLLKAARKVRKDSSYVKDFKASVKEMTESLISGYRLTIQKNPETFSNEDYDRLKKLSAICKRDNDLEQVLQDLTIHTPYIVVVDIESVWKKGHKEDSDRGKHYIFEIAFADLSGWSCSSLVHPTKKFFDENGARLLYGLHETKEKENLVVNFPKKFPEVWDQLWPEVQQRAGNNQVILVSHNENHDFPILRAEFSRNEKEAPVFSQADSLPMCALFGFESSARGKLIEKFSGKSQEGDHTALCDATSQVNLLYAFMGMMRFDHETFGRYVFQKSKPFNPA